MVDSFKYVAKDRDGKVHKGKIEAENEMAAASALDKQGLYITKLEVSKALTDYVETSAGKASPRELSLYFRYLHTMMAAGLSITHVLRVLVQEAPTKNLREVSKAVIFDLEKGFSLSLALGRHRKTFPDIAVAMVEAGEVGGTLEETFQNLSGYFKKESDLREKVVSALIYPGIVTGFALIILGVLLNFVLPTFADMFGTVGTELPPLTKFFIDLSAFVKVNALWIVVGVLSLFVLVRVFFRTSQGSKVRDWLLITLPVLGDFNVKVATSRFCRTLGTLTRTGVPILQALDIVTKVTGNAIIAQSILKASQAMEKGENMSVPLAEGKIFAPMVTQMMRVGEETGSMDVMLGRVSDIYDEEVDRSVKRLTSIIEPVIIIFLSVIVGFILLSVIVPMFDIITRVPA